MGCVASKKGETSMSLKLQFIKNNFKLDTIKHTHSLSSQLLDTIALNNDIFNIFVGLDSNRVKLVLGLPDYRNNTNSLGYRLGLCPDKLNCEAMFLNLIFNENGICNHANLDRSLKPEVIPNKGIQR
jgi:hypothetical protein